MEKNKRLKMTEKPYIPEYVRQLARELRQSPTPAEQVLWDHLRKCRLKSARFRRQHPIGRYIVDFYCHSHRLIIELDGSIHNGQQEYDAQRHQELEAQGYIVLRFRNEEVIYHLKEEVLPQIAAHL